jgi:D-serine deaminase-like pyridoxal phosphate-dependent protein
LVRTPDAQRLTPAMNISEVDTPSIVIDLDVMERNIRTAQEYCDRHGIAMRPHMKTHKTPEIGRMQVAAGAVGLTCAKLGEAEVMADGGIEDLMIAYPIWGQAKLRRLTELAQRCKVTVVFDSHEVAEGISRAAADAGTQIAALVEVDTGMHRCGVAPGPGLTALCRKVSDLPGLRFKGLMTYQGFLAGTLDERQDQMREEGVRIRRILDELSAAGLTCETVSGGTSPSQYYFHLTECVTENRAGTYVFNDRNMVAAGAAAWEDCAMRLAVTVVSDAVPGQIIVDGGSKTFTSDRSAFEGFGAFVEDPALVLEKMNEEHGYVKLNDSRLQHRIGDRLHVIPNHVCVAMNMHDEVWVHRGGEVVDTWRIAARGKVR